MQTALELSVSSKLDKHNLVQQKPHQAKRLIGLSLTAVRHNFGRGRSFLSGFLSAQCFWSILVWLQVLIFEERHVLIVQA